jgi:hypothetical protein
MAMRAQPQAAVEAIPRQRGAKRVQILPTFDAFVAAEREASKAGATCKTQKCGVAPVRELDHDHAPNPRPSLDGLLKVGLRNPVVHADSRSGAGRNVTNKEVRQKPNAGGHLPGLRAGLEGSERAKASNIGICKRVIGW